MPKLQRKVVIEPYKPYYYSAKFRYDSQVREEIKDIPGIKFNGSFYEIPVDCNPLVLSIFKSQGYQVEIKLVTYDKAKFESKGLNYLEQTLAKNILEKKYSIFEIESREVFDKAFNQIIQTFKQRNTKSLVVSPDKSRFPSTLYDFSTYRSISNIQESYDLIVLDDCEKARDKRTKTFKDLKAYLSNNTQAQIIGITEQDLTKEPKFLWSVWDLVRPGTCGTFWNFLKRYSNHLPTKYNNYNYEGLNPLTTDELELRLSYVYKRIIKEDPEDFVRAISQAARSPNFEEGVF